MNLRYQRSEYGIVEQNQHAEWISKSLAFREKNMERTARIKVLVLGSPMCTTCHFVCIGFHSAWVMIQPSTKLEKGTGPRDVVCLCLGVLIWFFGVMLKSGSLKKTHAAKWRTIPRPASNPFPSPDFPKTEPPLPSGATLKCCERRHQLAPF